MTASRKYGLINVSKAELEKFAAFRDEMAKAVDEEIKRAHERAMKLLCEPRVHVAVDPGVDERVAQMLVAQNKYGSIRIISDETLKPDEVRIRQPVTWERQHQGEFVPPAPPPRQRSAAELMLLPQHKQDRIRGTAEWRNAFAPTPPLPVDPLDEVIAGATLRQLLEWDMRENRDVSTDFPRSCWIPEWRAAVSAHWSAELRRKVESSRKADAERERLRVVVDLEDP